MFLEENNILEPKFTITINKKSYTVIGKFKILKAIQQELKTEITELSGQLLTMPFTDMAKLIRVGIYPETVEDEEVEKKRLSLDTIEEWVVDENGIDDTRCLLFDFLRTSIVPKKKRKEAHETAITLLKGLLAVQTALAERTTDSLGENTDNFA